MNDQFITSDFYLAAAIAILHESPIGIKPVMGEKNKLYFVFSNKDKKAEELSNMFYSGKLSVDPQRFSLEIRRLKAIVYDKKEQMKMEKGEI